MLLVDTQRPGRDAASSHRGRALPPARTTARTTCRAAESEVAMRPINLPPTIGAVKQTWEWKQLARG